MVLCLWIKATRRQVITHFLAYGFLRLWISSHGCPWHYWHKFFRSLGYCEALHAIATDYRFMVSISRAFRVLAAHKSSTRLKCFRWKKSTIHTIETVHVPVKLIQNKCTKFNTMLLGEIFTKFHFKIENADIITNALQITSMISSLA